MTEPPRPPTDQWWVHDAWGWRKADPYRAAAFATARLRVRLVRRGTIINDGPPHELPKPLTMTGRTQR